jgi:hypothetical protein
MNFALGMRRYFIAALHQAGDNAKQRKENG